MSQTPVIEAPEVEPSDDDAILHKPEPKSIVLSLTDVITDQSLQSRHEISQSVVDEYAEKMLAKESFPAPEVAFDGEKYYVWDGFQRVAAARQAGGKKMRFSVRPGTQRQAWLWSRGANDTHGVRRTIADKRVSVDSMLDDSEFGHTSENPMSNYRIAQICNVSKSFVGQRREAIYAVRTAKGETAEAPEADENSTETTADLPQNESPNIVNVDHSATAETSGVKSENKPNPSSTKPAQEPIGVIAGDGKLVMGSDSDDSVFDDGDAVTAQNAANEDDLTDDEWLKTLPLSEALSQHTDALHIFQHDALTWRQFKGADLLPRMKRLAASGKKHCQMNGTEPGTFTLLAARMGAVVHPAQWKRCPSCGGSRQYWQNRTSHKHEAPGTVKADGSNELTLRASLINCDKCVGGYEL